MQVSTEQAIPLTRITSLTRSSGVSLPEFVGKATTHIRIIPIRPSQMISNPRERAVPGRNADADSSKPQSILARRAPPVMPRKLELSGERFGRLRVIDQASKRCNGHICWICRCDCWNYTVTTGIHLNSGHTQSCGCIRAEYARKMGNAYKHLLATGDNEHTRLARGPARTQTPRRNECQRTITTIRLARVKTAYGSHSRPALDTKPNTKS